MNHLRHRWYIVLILYGLCATFTGWLLSGQWQGAELIRWSLGATAALAYVLLLFWRHLPDNRRPGEDSLLTTLGTGTILTLFRAMCYGLLAGFLLTSWPPGIAAWLPALLYTLAGLADYFDGYLARRSNHATVLGEILDMEYDALGLLVVVLLAIHWGQLPWWYVIIGIARYLFVFGMAVRRHQGKVNHELPPSSIRRVLAGLQMGMMSVVLWPIATPQVATLAGLLFSAPFLFIFLRDWFIVSGALDPDSQRYRQATAFGTLLFYEWLPLLIRLLTALAAAGLAWTMSQQFEQVVTAYADFGLPAAEGVTAVFLLLTLLTIPFLVLGVAGRFVALVLLIPAGFYLAAVAFTGDGVFAVAGSVYLLIFGTGRLSLWQPENRLVSRHAAEDSGTDPL